MVVERGALSFRATYLVIVGNHCSVSDGHLRVAMCYDDPCNFLQSFSLARAS